MPRNEWERLEWRELDRNTLWTRTGTGDPRWIAEHARGATTLRRVQGAGATFHSEVIAEIDEPYFKRGTLASFEWQIMLREGDGEREVNP